MPTNKTHSTNHGGPATADSQAQPNGTATPEPECGPWEHPATGGGSHDSALSSADEAPRLVTRGESITSPTPNKPKAALIDWLNFTFPFDFISADPQRISKLLDDQLFAALGYATTRFRNKGHLGYSDSWDLGNGFGILASGGKSQSSTCLVSLNGGGCTPIQDWQAVHDLMLSLNVKITRVDLAHDDFAGDYNITAGLEMLALGQFTTNGRPPNAMFVDDFDSGKGKTLYIGNRDSGKLLRVYEKGKQLGDSLSPWVRWELELHNKDRSIPLDVLLRPGDYLAGGYPCLAWVSETQDRIKTTRNQLKISFDHLVKHCRQSYGKLLYVVLGVR